MSGKFEVTKASDGRFMFNLKADNGIGILTSQMYEAKASALQGIESVRVNSQTDGQFERSSSTKGEPFFTLKAVNGQVVGRSQMYSSAAAMENGIASVAKNAPAASLIDLTT